MVISTLHYQYTGTVNSLTKALCLYKLVSVH